jgi:hypothetical protein
MSEYSHGRAYLDPLGLVLLADGSYAREIELALSDDRDRAAPTLADPILRLDAARARALALELLALAEQAEDPRPARRLAR